MALFSADDLAKLRRPHVAPVWFAELHLPGGLQRVHDGIGRVTIGGHEWRGVTDPLGAQVALETLVDPQFGYAAAVTIAISSANPGFFQSFRQAMKGGTLEGSAANLYWAGYDQETAEYVIPLKLLFPGFITSPAMERDGIGTRTVAITLESAISHAMNFQFGGKWNAADQNRRFPGDRGGQYIGVKVNERFG